MPPGAAQLVTLMNHENQDQYNRIERIYWTVTRSVLQGVIEDIRSRLVTLVAEMKAGVEPGEKLPSAEIANQAVEVAIHGDENRVKVRQTGHKTTISHGDHKGWARKALEVGAWVAGIAILILTLVIYWDTIAGWF
jgi:alpha-D-ribose 1-methylphosphonate 5-triphosphate diphosphatase PhnM